MERVKLQVPMRRAVYQGLKKRAEELGFDSPQAYVRFWAKGVGDVQRSNRGLRQPAQQALLYLELLLAMAPKEPKTIEEALQYVDKQLRQTEVKRHLDALLKKRHQI